VPIKAPRLNPGDTIGIIAPASAPPDPKAVDHSVTVLERLGFKPKLAPNVRKRRGFLAGTDRDRASDLMKMFADSKVKAILCLRGGYGTPRLLPLLDYKAIRSHPKIFIGFSDITALHSAFLLKSGLISFHGPMLNSDLIKPDCPPFTIESLLRTIMHAEPPGSLKSGLTRSLNPHLKLKTKHSKLPDASSPIALRRGTATGLLIGGNLSLLCGLVGTDYQPSFKNKILFFEDVDEPPYRFDRKLTHLMNAGLLQQASGIAVGTNANSEDPKAKTSKEYRQTLDDVLKERLQPLKIPVVMNLPFGHVPLNATVPIGVRAKLDANKCDLIITESAVS
jgi:muramoyltetrapeptide carboxypeptidase